MKLRELIEKADADYPSPSGGSLLLYLDLKGNLMDDKGIEVRSAQSGVPVDPLGLFIVREIADATRNVRSDKDQRDVVVQALASAMAQIESIKDAFEA